MGRRNILINNQMHKLNFIFSGVAALFLVCVLYSCVSSCRSTEETSKPNPSAAEVVEDEKNKVDLPSEAEFKDPNSILVVANKANPLPSDYEPDDLVNCKDVGITVVGSNCKLRKVAAEALKEMCDAAKKDGVDVFLGSGYRSYSNQDKLWHSYADNDGAEAADNYSARAGYSEHQTGLAFDAAQGNGDRKSTRLNSSH